MSTYYNYKIGSADLADSAPIVALCKEFLDRDFLLPPFAIATGNKDIAEGQVLHVPLVLDCRGNELFHLLYRSPDPYVYYEVVDFQGDDVPAIEPGLPIHTLANRYVTPLLKDQEFADHYQRFLCTNATRVINRFDGSQHQNFILHFNCLNIWNPVVVDTLAKKDAANVEVFFVFLSKPALVEFTDGNELTQLAPLKAFVQFWGNNGLWNLTDTIFLDIIHKHLGQNLKNHVTIS